MNETLINFLNSLKFGAVQTSENLSVVPIFQSNGRTLKYISLDSAIKKGYVEIKEVSSSGSVPDLLLINKSDSFVFILHGEELLGAKQNRIVNTSMLINKQSEVQIPVSCVERGRWNYVSKNFTTSGFIVPAELKKKTLFAAKESLKRNLGFRADQSEVWEHIDEISYKTKVVSRTSALHDVEKTYEKKYDELISELKLLPEQKGIVAFINGKIKGLEFISRKSVFAKYYKKILKSFAFNAILSDEKQLNPQPEFCLSQIQEELNFVKSKHWRSFKSVGLGFDYRNDTENAVGSILQVNNDVISFNCYFEN